MIEVLFSEHEGLTMRMAKTYDPKARRRAGSFGIIGLDKDLGSINRILTRLRYFWPKVSGKPVGGNKEDVVYIDFWLDIGRLNDPIGSEYRKNLLLDLRRIYTQDDYFDMDDFEDEWKRCLSQLDRLNNFMNNGEDFRIWYSDSPYSLCGFYYVCHLLKDSKCKVSTIKFPDNEFAFESEWPNADSWRSIDEGEFNQFLPLEKPLTDEEIQKYAGKWEDLVEGESDLRAIVVGELKGVPEDYYDDTIRKEIPDGQFRLGTLIGTLIESYPHCPPDSWYSKRILKMIDDGELVMVKKGIETFYGSILERKS